MGTPRGGVGGLEGGFVPAWGRGRGVLFTSGPVPGAAESLGKQR